MNRTLLTLAAASLMAASAAQAATRCADFLSQDVGTLMPTQFKINGFKFKDAAGGMAPVVQAGVDSVDTPYHGLVYDKRGLQVTPPKPTHSVRVRLLKHGGTPLKVVAYDANGGVQASGLCTNENLSEELTVVASSSPIARIMLTGGSDRGLVDQICTID